MAISTVTPQALTRTVQDFLSEAAGAVVLENGAVAFDLAQSKYSISGEYNRCLLHLWSAERNAVRRVLEAEVKNGTLRLAVQKLGQARPTRLEICRERDRRTPTVRRLARAAYEVKLRRSLDRNFPDFKVTRLTTGVDLEKSFGPIYTRGLMKQGRSVFALLGVNGHAQHLRLIRAAANSANAAGLVQDAHRFPPSSARTLANARERCAFTVPSFSPVVRAISLNSNSST